MLHFENYLKQTSRAQDILLANVIAKPEIQINQLKTLVKRQRTQVQTNAVNLNLVSVGINNILALHSLKQIRNNFFNLLKVFQQNLPSDSVLVLATLPPYPRYQHTDVMDRINKFNGLMSSTFTTNNIRCLRWEFDREVSFYFKQHCNDAPHIIDGMHLTTTVFRY